MPRKAGALLLKSVSQLSLCLEASWAMSSPPNYSPYLEPSLTLPTKSLERIAVVQGLHAFWDVHFPLRTLQWRQNPNSPVIGRNFWHWEGNVLASRWVRSFRKKILLVPVLPFVKHSAFVSLPPTVTFSVSRRAALSPCERGIHSCGQPSQGTCLLSLPLSGASSAYARPEYNHFLSRHPAWAGVAFPLYRPENHAVSRWQNLHRGSVANLRFRLKSVLS